MNPHGLHYMDLQQPVRAPQRAIPQLPSWMLALLALLVLAVQLLFTMIPLQAAVTVTPVRRGEAQAFEIPPISAEDARIEGFRAGVATATEEGCPLRLAQPIAMGR